MEEFIGAGFKAVVVALDSKFLTRDDLGKRIDLAWMKRIEGLRRRATGVPITYCGENGEYHTFVFGGPSFKSDIKIKTGNSVMRNGYWLIDVLSSQ
jgi:diphthamide synthase (EF-2-diphthine--ammonia ligase)